MGGCNVVTARAARKMSLGLVLGVLKSRVSPTAAPKTDPHSSERLAAAALSCTLRGGGWKRGAQRGGRFGRRELQPWRRR
jgi:hypothetical protein